MEVKHVIEGARKGRTKRSLGGLLRRCGRGRADG